MCALACVASVSSSRFDCVCYHVCVCVICFLLCLILSFRRCVFMRVAVYALSCGVALVFYSVFVSLFGRVSCDTVVYSLCVGAMCVLCVCCLIWRCVRCWFCVIVVAAVNCFPCRLIAR